MQPRVKLALGNRLYRWLLPSLFLFVIILCFASYFWAGSETTSESLLRGFPGISQGFSTHKSLVLLETDNKLLSEGLARKDLDSEEERLQATQANILKENQGSAQARSHLSGSALVDSLPYVSVHETNCAKLFNKDPVEFAQAISFLDTYPRIPVPDDAYIQLASNCAQFRRDRQYIMQPLSKEEEFFPIAYSIMIFKDVEQTERLLRAIYQPQNYYCIHVDEKSSPGVRQSISAITNCFDNVFMASRSVDVQWAWYSVLEPDLICMEDLWKYKKWKYFINLTGQEFPLKTNRELVKILKVYNGANDVEGTVKRRNPERTELVHQGFFPTDQRKEPPPVEVTLTKGAVHVTASRAFVDFILHDQRALQFRDWVKDTGVPDETFFSSLNHSPQLGVPGAYIGEPETDPDRKPFLTRFKNWGTWPFDYPCAGKRVRMVCVFGLGDLPLLQSRPELFANKFHNDFEPLAYSCMEEWHFNKTKLEVQGKKSFDTSYYKALSFVNHHV